MLVTYVGPKEAHPVFIYYYVHVNLPLRQTELRLVDLFDELDGWAESAYRTGEELRARIGVGGKRPLVAKTVRLEVGTPARSEGGAMIPVSWEATGTPGLFPKMQGDLVITPLGPDLTQLELRGSYEPPLGAVGRVLDRAVLHRIAEASVKGFLDRIADTLEEENQEPEPVARET
ncbi:MAG: hypothetical protein ACE5KX_06525 [Acidimicrobiia bacterium]